MVLNTSGDILGTLGSIFVIALTLGGTVIVLFAFGWIVSRFKQRPEVEAPAATATAPMIDDPARRRLLGIMRTLDQVRGPAKTKAKRALTQGETEPAKTVFEIAADKYPAAAARGLALIAEHAGDTDAAAAHYAEMHEANAKEMGARHPLARQGALLYAAFLREKMPTSPKLAELEEMYGAGIGA